MVEAEIESIKNKLKSDDFDIISLEKKVGKLEKKIIQMESKLNNPVQNQESETDSSDSDGDIDIDKILKELEIMDTDINKLINISNSNSIENLIDVYLKFKMKLNAIKIKNDNYKLSIEYL
jgi:hypothetical protein